jgi:hypothetical protein
VVEMTLEINLYKLRTSFHHCLLVKNWTNGKLGKDLHAKTYKIGKTFVASLIFHAGNILQGHYVYVNHMETFCTKSF